MSGLDEFLHIIISGHPTFILCHIAACDFISCDIIVFPTRMPWMQRGFHPHYIHQKRCRSLLHREVTEQREPSCSHVWPSRVGTRRSHRIVYLLPLCCLTDFGPTEAVQFIPLRIFVLYAERSFNLQVLVMEFAKLLNKRIVAFVNILIRNITKQINKPE